MRAILIHKTGGVGARYGGRDRGCWSFLRVEETNYPVGGACQDVRLRTGRVCDGMYDAIMTGEFGDGLGRKGGHVCGFARYQVYSGHSEVKKKLLDARRSRDCKTTCME